MTASTEIVVVPKAVLSALVTEAVTIALETRTAEVVLIDRASLSKALRVSTSTVDRLVHQGMPCLFVADARRFELPLVLEWLRARKAARP